METETKTEILKDGKAELDNIRNRVTLIYDIWRSSKSTHNLFSRSLLISLGYVLKKLRNFYVMHYDVFLNFLSLLRQRFHKGREGQEETSWFVNKSFLINRYSSCLTKTKLAT